MRKASPELSRARREEIISACASLYETMSFREITIGDIGKKTSFTRTSIYNYFHTKEEIFLALLQREHELWAKDLSALAEKGAPLPAPVFAEKLAATLEDRPVMLRLMAMNLYDMETNSRTERLADFKRSYAAVTAALFRALERAFPSMTKVSSPSSSASIPTRRTRRSRSAPWRWPASPMCASLYRSWRDASSSASSLRFCK